MNYKITPYNVSFTAAFPRTKALKDTDRAAKQLLCSSNSDAVEFACEYFRAKKRFGQTDTIKEVLVPERYLGWQGIRFHQEYSWRYNGLFHSTISDVPEGLPTRNNHLYSIMNDLIQAAKEIL